MKIAVINQKGGVGKTAVANNLAYGLAVLKKKRVLLVDLDSQANATMLYFSEIPENNTINEVMRDKDYNPGNAIFQATVMQGEEIVENLYILPSNADMRATEEIVMSKRFRETLLSKQLEKVESLFDYIIMDCPAAVGLITSNAVYAADKVLIPLDSSLDALKGVVNLFGSVDEIKDTVDFKGCLILKNRLDARTSRVNEYGHDIIGGLGKTVLKTAIRSCADVTTCGFEGKPVWLFDKNSKATKDFMDLTNEIARLK